jgi:hypothetical protein
MMSDLEAGRELDKQIAEMLGWKIEKLAGGFRIRNGDSKWALPLAASEEEAWQDAHLYKYFPHYSTDLNAAASLPVPEKTWLEILISWGGRIAARYVPHDTTKHFSGWDYPYSTNGTEAEVRCLAWLKWIKRQEKITEDAT